MATALPQPLQPGRPERVKPQVMLNHHLLTHSLRYFARNCLKIKTDQGLISFEFNQAQEYIDWRAKQQLKRTGKVRMVIVKARQQGGSEYVSARGYKYAVQNPAKSVYILSHEAKSVSKLFDKVDRYYRYAPPSTKPQETTSNRFQKKWVTESEYTVGTAGSDNTGRSDTIQFAHLSEPAHYDNDEGIKSGLLQTVSDALLTEIWWESTCNGMNWFHGFVMGIVEGKNLEYELIFIPWYWADKYRSIAPADFQRTEEEQLLAASGTYFNVVTKQIEARPLNDDQLFWRRNKIAVLGERLFKQEYPATLEEAFQSTGNAFIPADLVTKAKNSTLEETNGPIILGVDPARTGDRTIIVLRHGRQVKKVWKYDEMDEMRLAGICADFINSHDVDKCFIDYGLGYGTVDRLRERGFASVVEGVHFGESATESDLYINKRAEMFFTLRDWFKDGEVRIPNDSDITTDLASLPEPELTSNGRWQFMAKKDIKKNYGKSPDILDAMALTFAEKVRPKGISQTTTMYTQNSRSGLSELTTTARIRRGEGETNQPLKERREFRRSGRDPV